MFCVLGKCLMNSGLLHMKILRLVTGQSIYSAEFLLFILF